MPPANGRCRVLYVQAAPGGGSATGLLDLIRALDFDRFEATVLLHEAGSQAERFRSAGATVLCLSDGKGENDGAVRVRSRSASSIVPRLVRRDYPLAVRTLRVLRRLDVHIIHHNNNPSGNRPSIAAARVLGIPQVSHVRFMPRYGWTDRRLAASVDTFLFVSRAIAAHCCENLGIAETRGEVFLDPFDFVAFDAAAAARSRVRGQLGFGPEHKLVVNVGRLVPWKGQDVFLTAMADVLRTEPSARALIVGAPGSKPDQRAYSESLRRLAARLGIAANVTFTGYRPDVPALLAAADVCVHSSTKPEPFGRVIVEAMAARRPVVATHAGGVTDIITEGETGLLIPLGDARACARAIITLLGSSAEAIALGERARRSAEARFSPVRAGARIGGIYDAVLAGAQHRSRALAGATG